MTAVLEGGEWSAARPGRTLPPGKTRCPFYRRLGGPQGRSGRAENLVPTGIRSRIVQPVAQSLYRLSYPAHIKCICICLISLSVSYLYYRPVLVCMVFIVFSVFSLFCYFHFCLFLVLSPSNFWSPGWCLPFVGIVHLPLGMFSSDERSLFSGRCSGRNYEPMTDLHAAQRLRMCGTVQALPVCLRALDSWLNKRGALALTSHFSIMFPVHLFYLTGFLTSIHVSLCRSLRYFLNSISL